MKKISIAILLLAGATGAHATALTLDNPNLSGLSGATVGWGFTLTSTPVPDGDGTITPWLVISDAGFQLDGGVFPVGVFSPFITSSFTVIGPDTGNGEVNPWIQAFDNTAQTGIASYAINDFQSPGDQATGAIVVTYDEYSVSPNDPSFDPELDTLANGLTVSARASVTVTGAASTPEPGSLSLLVPALASLAFVLRKTQRRNFPPIKSIT